MSNARTHKAWVSIFGSAALGGLLVLPALAADDTVETDPNAVWVAERARVFSEVCMGTAPGFEGFAVAAKAAGMQLLGSEYVFFPEATVVLLPAEGDAGTAASCGCDMIVGAPDLDAMLIGLAARLMDDWKDSFLSNPEDEDEAMNFEREGTDVTVRFQSTVTDDGTNWVRAAVIAPGECPA